MELERWGSGPRVYLGLHGWGGNRTTFEPLRVRLPSDVTFWSADLPGYGVSPRPAVFTEAAVVDEIVAGVRRVTAESGARPVLVGNCLGAILALATALRIERELAGIVGLDAFPFLPWYFSLFTRGSFGRRAYFATFASALGRRLTNQALAARRTEDSDLTASFARVDHDVTLAYLQVMRAIGGAEHFAGLGLRVTLLHGERTFGAVRSGGERWRRALPQVRTLALAGAGHLPLQEAPDAVAAVVFGEER